MILRESPAKINLILRVLGRREDGYHDIESLMQRIDICDTLSFRIRGSGISLKCPDSSLPENEDNLVYRAAGALMSYASCDAGVEITIKKRIPVAAGLGGGSSNAATTLVGLNDLLDLGLTRDELMVLGASLGADVPFFIFERPAWATGIGEKLQEVNDLPPMWFLIVNPGFQVATGDVYGLLKMGLTKAGRKYNIPSLKTVPHVVQELHNDLETVSLNLYPVLSEIKEHLIAHGALGSLMSGSGPTVFGIFEDREAAARAESQINKIHVGTVFLASSIR